MFSYVARTYTRWKYTVFILILLLVALLVTLRTDQTTSLNEHRLIANTLQSSPKRSDNEKRLPYGQSDEKDMVIKKRFDERNALKNKMCNTSSYIHLSDKSKHVKQLVSHLGKKRIKYCRIPKVGTTYLQSLEKHVLRYPEYRTGKNIYTKKLMMVREPYSRLLSAYIGKFVTNPPWQRDYGAFTVRRFRPGATRIAKKCGNDVTFPEFLQYAMKADETGWKRNTHFVPLHKQCNPCRSDFDFIGHLETIQDDLSFALKSVNISIDMYFNDEEQTMKGKTRDIIDKKVRILKCETMCSALSKVWWSFQARGLITMENAFPLKEEENCLKITQTEFSDMAWNAHLQSVGRFNKSKQKREALVNLYLQASLEIRLNVQEWMRKDFELYGYDPQPGDIFPELKK